MLGGTVRQPQSDHRGWHVPGAFLFAAILAGTVGGPDRSALAGQASSGCPHDQRSIDLLIANLTGDESSEVRATAAEALACSGDPKALAPLLDAIAEHDPVIRLTAVDAIARFGQGDKFDGDTPFRLGAERPATAQSAQVHARLVRIGREGRTMEALSRALRQPALDGMYDWSRSDAAWALGRLGNAQSRPALEQALEDGDNMVRAEAARALMRLGDDGARSVLAQHLADWFYGPRVLASLRLAGWSPTGDSDRVHLWIAGRRRAQLVRYWQITKSVLLDDLRSRFAIDALYAAIAIGQPDFIPDATARLVNGGDRRMAEAFLNCGQPDLKRAAEAWARRQGFSILAGPGMPPVSWGEM